VLKKENEVLGGKVRGLEAGRASEEGELLRLRSLRDEQEEVINVLKGTCLFIRKFCCFFN